MVNPAQIRHFAKALGKRAKTDAIDAEVIARFVAATGEILVVVQNISTIDNSDFVMIA